jgi:hypothetical protein
MWSPQYISARQVDAAKGNLLQLQIVCMSSLEVDWLPLPDRSQLHHKTTNNGLLYSRLSNHPSVAQTILLCDNF